MGCDWTVQTNLGQEARGNDVTYKYQQRTVSNEPPFRVVGRPVRRRCLWSSEKLILPCGCHGRLKSLQLDRLVVGHNTSGAQAYLYALSEG